MKMKRYWLYVAVLSTVAALIMAGARQWWWGALGLAAGLLAGLMGVMLIQYVPRLRERYMGSVICVIALGGLIQFAGVELSEALLWALGFWVMLTIPLAGICHDTLEKDLMYPDTP
jgi:MFS family permease